VPADHHRAFEIGDVTKAEVLLKPVPELFTETG
jgi:hypothetical protein